MNTPQFILDKIPSLIFMNSQMELGWGIGTKYFYLNLIINGHNYSYNNDSESL